MLVLLLSTALSQKPEVELTNLFWFIILVFPVPMNRLVGFHGNKYGKHHVDSRLLEDGYECDGNLLVWLSNSVK